MKTVNVAAAIIVKGSRIFATQRGYGKFKDGWEFPGGKVEKGETFEAALVREIKEELDAEIKVLSLFDTVEYDYPDFHLTMQCFICELISTDIVLKEHEDAKWVEKEQLPSLDWLPADVEVVRKLSGEMHL